MGKIEYYEAFTGIYKNIHRSVIKYIIEIYI